MTMLLLGTSIMPGVALGPVHKVEHNSGKVEYCKLQNTGEVESETRRLEEAVETALAELELIRVRFLDGSDELAALFNTHLLMLKNSSMVRASLQLIRDTYCNAEWALMQQRDELLRRLDVMNDPYLRGRRDDVEQVCDRVQRILLRQPPPRHERANANPLAKRIILSHQFSAADIIILQRQGAAALLSERGGITSHSAILARNLGLPMITNLHRARHYLQSGEFIIMDGEQGLVLANPNSELLRRYRRTRRRAGWRERRGARMPGADAVTLDGTKIQLRANISNPGDVESVKRFGADGVGLYRTEWLYMNREQAPDENEHYRVYRQLLERLEGRVLTIRLAELEPHQLPERDPAAAPGNPAMGLRSLRLGLNEPEIFAPQLRAILRAATLGPLRLLLPMVTNIQELNRFLELYRNAADVLERNGQLHEQNVAMGIMIEVPAAAVCADLFAKRLDFLAIGSNDLTQYTLAADRNDGELSHVYEPLHPSLLRLIKGVQKAAEQARIPAYLCGELAGEPECLPLLIGLGLRELSVTPSKLPGMRRALAKLWLKESEQLAATALQQETALEINTLLRKAAAS